MIRLQMGVPEKCHALHSSRWLSLFSIELQCWGITLWTNSNAQDCGPILTTYILALSEKIGGALRISCLNTSLFYIFSSVSNHKMPKHGGAIRVFPPDSPADLEFPLSSAIGQWRWEFPVPSIYPPLRNQRLQWEITHWSIIFPAIYLHLAVFFLIPWAFSHKLPLKSTKWDWYPNRIRANVPHFAWWYAMGSQFSMGRSMISPLEMGYQKNIFPLPSGYLT